jgi:hypothetical protein
LGICVHLSCSMPVFPLDAGQSRERSPYRNKMVNFARTR